MVANALDKAKEALKLEKKLQQHRIKHNLQEQTNVDLTYSVRFTMANMLHANKMYDDALDMYSSIVRNKAYVTAGRLRVNMGNIYYEQKDYDRAIKMYVRVGVRVGVRE
eukprot:TRINITY_DN2314_c0_g2_i10.p1 TRINITY_DN2314_c0_g2~~TRINITY_DN2314_c0_g2_i10.p1  ORF type:complete len:109 (+),score=38.43 TRINITY_DN2314_c0_g2_i10:77-403(+)